MKTCTKCGIDKELGEFCKNKNHSDGRNNWCKQCVKEYKYNYNKTPEGNLRIKWRAIHQRCYNSKNKRFNDYGGRGITVCPDWHRSNPDGFDNFKEWALNNGYDIELQIDRIDNDGSYSPDNCRFVTPAKNNRNQRKRRGCSSKYRGVSWRKNKGKWGVEIILPDGTHKHLGLFDSEQSAAQNYDWWAFFIYGGEAKLNCLEKV